MRVIYKYPLEFGPNLTRHEVFGGVRPLSAQTQYDSPVVWIEVDQESPQLQTFEFSLVPTGAPFVLLNEGFEFLDTLQMMDGQLVFHVYWRRV